MPQPGSRKNSRFSDHIDALEYFCLQNWTNSCDAWAWSNQEMMRVVHFMLSAFVSISWSPMLTWHSYTRALGPLRDVMVWRLTKTEQAFVNIVPSYRPTKLQMSVRYPSIIDWTPWPSLRDKLIIYHSANPYLDDLICEIGNAYVVPADLSELVVCDQPVVGYVSVWDLVRAISPDTTKPALDERVPQSLSGNHIGISMDQGWLEGFQNPFQSIVGSVLHENEPTDVSLPASSADALFSSRALAVQAFKKLGMDQGAFCFYLDPAFFEKHPELYDSQANLMAGGVALRPSTQHLFPPPYELDTAVITRYGELSKSALDAANASMLIAA